MMKIQQGLLMAIMLQTVAFAQMKNVPGESLILGHGEPVDGIQKAPLLTADNAKELLQQQKLEFKHFDAPVVVWRYALQDKHGYMDRALETETMLIASNQNSFVIFSYKNPQDFMCAGIVNGRWYLGHCSGIDLPEAAQDADIYRIEHSQGHPQVGTSYTLHVEISVSKCIFNAFEKEKSVFKAVRTYPDGTFDRGSSGTAVYGNVNQLPLIENFKIKRLFPVRTTFPTDTGSREMPPRDVSPTTKN